MGVQVKTKNSVTLVNLQGDLDHHTAKEIRLEIDSEINRRLPSVLILDFSQVSFMDSSGIGLVMGRFKLMQERGGEIKIICPQGYIRKVMTLAGINRLAKIVDNPEKLLKEFSEKNSENSEENLHKEDEEVETGAN